MRLFLVPCLLITVHLFGKDAWKTFNSGAPEDHLVFIEGGTIRTQGSDSEIDTSEFGRLDGKTINSFYLSAYELTNFQYMEFLYYLNRTDSEKYSEALPDTLVWRTKLVYCEPYVEYYFRHPAYRHYPMVGVSHRQAILFCEWLTEMYNSYEDRKFKKVQFRLPSKAEWCYAALSGGQYREKKKKDAGDIIYYAYSSFFPWSSYSLQDENGAWLANFTPINQASVRKIDGTLNYEGKTITNTFYIGSPGNYQSTAGQLNDAADLTAPVYSYLPGLTGLYNMAGNVEEMVAEYGITKGGAWNDPGYYLQNASEEKYDSTTETSSARGFRIAMDVLEEF